MKKKYYLTYFSYVFDLSLDNVCIWLVLEVQVLFISSAEYYTFGQDARQLLRH